MWFLVRLSGLAIFLTTSLVLSYELGFSTAERLLFLSSLIGVGMWAAGIAHTVTRF